MKQFVYYNPTEIDKKYNKYLYRCSKRENGQLWYYFKKNKTNKKARVVICFINEKLVGWGLRFKKSTRYSIMVYVYKKFRRKGIGSNIFKKLSIGLSTLHIKIYPNNSNKKFFEKLYG